VYVDNTSGPGDRPVRPLPDVIRAVAEPLRRPTG
jgi:acyl-CoA thioester hydrolase